MATGGDHERESVNDAINKNTGSSPEEDLRGGRQASQGDSARPEHLVEKVDFPFVSEDQPVDESFGLDTFKGVKMIVSGEIGKTTIRVRDLIKLKAGSMLRLDRLADENLTMLVNEAPFAYGEIVVINDRYGVRITSFFDDDSKED